jgi:tol-pal system protein YbgF
MSQFKPLLIGGLMLPLAISVATAAEMAPVVDLTVQSANKQSYSQPVSRPLTTEQRLERLERQVDNQSMLELFQRLDAVQQELQQLRGMLEEQGFQVNGIKQRQRDLYLDIDRRIANLEQAAKQVVNDTPVISAAPVTPVLDTNVPTLPVEQTQSAADVANTVTDSAAPVSAAVAGGQMVVAPATQQPSAERVNNPMLEQAAYEKALSTLMAGQYEQAAAEFEAFLTAYPAGSFVDNAQYWLGEAYYVTRKFDPAAVAFAKVVEATQSRKRPDAMLKLGYTYFEQKKLAEAKALLEQVQAEYPGSSVAGLAQKRLQDIRASVQ